MQIRRAAVPAVMLTFAAGTLAHDEDWRKFADRQEPVRGDIWINPALTGVADSAVGGRAASPFASSGVTLFAQIPTNNLFPSAGGGADCWGYTSPSGREYAIMTARNGTGFVEITDPLDPQVLAWIPSASSIWHDVKTMGEYAYIVNESGNGIQVIDLSNIDNGVVDFVQNKVQGGHTTTHNIISNEESGYIYLSGANVSNGGLIAVDVQTDPSNPTFAGAWPNRYVHDAQVVTMTVGPFAGREIAFCFNGGAGLEILDVTDKSNMVRIGGGTYPGLQYTHQGWISEDQEWLYINDELDEGVTVSQTTTRVFRIHDPDFSGPPSAAPSVTNPVFAGTFTTGLPAIDHNLYTQNGVIFQANYRSGLRIFDATADPANPQEIAFIDTYPEDDGASFNGAWSVYPYFDSGTVIVSDIERGLFVLRVDVGPNASSIVLDIVGEAPTLVGPSESVTVVATATENNTEVDSNGYQLAVSVSGGAESIVPMTPTGTPGEFSAVIGNFECFDTVSYRVVASDTTGRAFESGTSSFLVADGEAEIANGENPAQPFTTNATASAGEWEFGVPVDAGRGDPPTDSDGTGSAWLTQNDLGPSNDGNSDIDNGEVSLTTESYDLSAGGEFRYDYWLNDVAGGPLSPEDTLAVEVSRDGGSFVLSREYTTAGAVWRSDTITFGPAGDFPASSDVRVRFTATDLGDQGVVEAGIDGISVVAFDCTPADTECPGDLTGDNLVGPSDLFALLAAFGQSTDAGLSGGDLDGDGTVGPGDLFDLLAVFGTGC